MEAVIFATFDRQANSVLLNLMCYLLVVSYLFGLQRQGTKKMYSQATVFMWEVPKASL